MSLNKLFRLPLTRRPKLFISYRRDDSDADAEFLSARLARHFGKKRVFVDRDAMPVGRDFIETIKAEVASCDALLAVIGKQWLTASSGSEPRLNEPEDIVRLEIATALGRDIPVIPVLVRGATMPRAEELPGELKRLARRHAFEISRAHRSEDLERLIVEIKKTLSGQKAARVRRHSVRAARPAPAPRPRKVSRSSKRSAVILSAATLLTVLLTSVWLILRFGNRAENSNRVSRISLSTAIFVLANEDASQETFGSDEANPIVEGLCLPPWPAPPMTPIRTPTVVPQAAPVEGQRPVETAAAEGRSNNSQITPAPTPTPQPNLIVNATNDSWLAAQPSHATVPTDIFLSKDTWSAQPQLQLPRTDVTGIRGTPIKEYESPIMGPPYSPYSLYSPYNSPWAAPGPTLNPTVKKYQGYLKMREGLKIEGKPVSYEEFRKNTEGSGLRGSPATPRRPTLKH